MKVLITGGAGYIGSHVALDLMRKGFEPVVLDDLSKGHREAVLCEKFYKGEVGDKALVKKILKQEKIDAVIHLAANSLVGESVVDPSKYFNTNIVQGLSLLDVMVECGVKKMVFSSTAAVYGDPERVPIMEDHPKNPTNPYGISKLSFENFLHSYDIAYGLKFVSLRYFNAAGSDPNSHIGEDHRPESHLIPIILQVAFGPRKHLELYGTDYPTKDGTCIRDYIHVSDLADAHVLALQALITSDRSKIYNLGNGQGHSNREVIETAKKITGISFPVLEASRRAGDPAILVASSELIKRELKWEPKYPELDTIIETAWRWHQKYPQGYNKI